MLLHELGGGAAVLSSLAPSSIRAMPDVLCWTGHRDVLDRIHESWLGHIQQRLSQVLDERNEESLMARAHLSALQTDSPERFVRVLLAPETVFRLLPGRPGTTAERIEFVRKSALAELVLAGQAHSDEELWTASGDTLIGSNGQLVRLAVVDGMMPIDTYSPFSRDIDLTGAEYRIGTSRPPMAGGDLQVALERLTAVRNGLAGTGDILLPFVVRFTKALVLQNDESQPFSSGSNGDYVGRSVISNPHHVSEVDLADAVVHEAIHSLLYMQEEQQPWALDEALYDPIPRTVSPWSGRPLPIRQFLQACFVWYGLLHLWALAAQYASFNSPRQLLLFKRAAGGFLKGPLEASIDAYRAGLSDDIVATVVELQDRVLSAIPS